MTASRTRWIAMSEAELSWDVAAPFTETVTVEALHVDAFGHSNNVAYLGWLERVAWAHSLWLGLNFDDYRRLDAGCVVRRHELDYLAATFAGDELHLGTWVAECDGRLTMWRAYQIIRASDRRTVMRARTQFVCVDMKSGRPRRMPPEFVAAYRPLA
jgi:acyl-CoA thioester hydrolase